MVAFWDARDKWMEVNKAIEASSTLVAIWCIFLMYFLLDISPKYTELALTSTILCIKFNVFFMLFWTLPQYIKKYPKAKYSRQIFRFYLEVIFVEPILLTYKCT